jgi:hypothetical protein
MTELRKKFEALPAISAVTNRGIYFCKENNMYNGGVDNDYYWINGAWYAFQEQQKLIEDLKSGLTDIWTNLDDRQSKEWIIEHCENIIKDLLK